MRALANPGPGTPTRRPLGSSLVVTALACVALLFSGAVRAEPALWVVKSEHATVYLFGTIHVLRADVAWKTPKIQKAFDDSQSLTLEIVDVGDKQAAVTLIQKYGLDLAHPLSGQLTDDENSKLNAAYVALGMPPKAFDAFAPWFAGVTFSVLPLVKQGYDPNAGVDVLLKQAAQARKEPIDAFETSEQQVQYFANMPKAEQLTLLDEALRDYPDTVKHLDELAKDWMRGDVDAIAKSLNDDISKDDPALYDLLLTRRNVAFADQIATKLKGSGVSFIAIGAAHLAGPDSVQVQLAKHGFKAERL